MTTNWVIIHILSSRFIQSNFLKIYGISNFIFLHMNDEKVSKLVLMSKGKAEAKLENEKKT